MIRSARMGQAVILMLIVAIAASCTATKEYSSKLFAPRVPVEKESKATSLRFLDIDSADKNTANWVSTDFIMGRDTLSKTLALDKLSLVFPAGSKQADSPAMSTSKTAPAVLVAKPVTPESEPVARYMNQGEVRTKRSRE